ncbi:hypothetical protein CKO31_22495 [Thiohalocapsa halophila]|uniref:Uncharacterized protein n=1 Tax=Thiohalocapsa halophila TaxID=69359 RepID=A0ABS1CNF3_9GAMM|nr:hypothetical protein [Thiohalocapsa halophila]MBK1633466.1 hypothetical protein [Thiohalocapsa halophila]
MQITLHIPDPPLRRLEAICGDVPRAVLEGFAADAYRTGTLSRAEVGQLLEPDAIGQTEACLSAHQAKPAPTCDEVADDARALREATGS